MPGCLNVSNNLFAMNSDIQAILDGTQRLGTLLTREDTARLLEEAASIATAPADWRTVEMLPEDYYAL